MKIISILLFTFVYGLSLNLIRQEVQINDVKNNKAQIEIGNLSIGQSGLIVHKFQNGNDVILGYGIITESDTNTSTIKIFQDDFIKQDAIPTTNLQASSNDFFILNHLYETVLVIAPNLEAEEKIQKTFYQLNFINKDFFAGYLQLNNVAAPTLETFSEFARVNDIGLIFLVVNQKMHIIDMLSQKVIHTLPIKYNQAKAEIPFYSNITDINKKAFSFFKSNTITNYHKYYSKLLGVNNDGQ